MGGGAVGRGGRPAGFVAVVVVGAVALVMLTGSTAWSAAQFVAGNTRGHCSSQCCGQHSGCGGQHSGGFGPSCSSRGQCSSPHCGQSCSSRGRCSGQRCAQHSGCWGQCSGGFCPSCSCVSIAAAALWSNQHKGQRTRLARLWSVKVGLLIWIQSWNLVQMK